MNFYEGTPCRVCGNTTRYKSQGHSCVDCAKRKSRVRAATPEGREKKRLQYHKPGGVEDRRNRNLMAHYGITLAQYDLMSEEQFGCCAICHGPPGGSCGRFHVDHDHKTGKIRALLCHTCNVGLGSFKDDPLRLEAAAEYLREHGRG